MNWNNIKMIKSGVFIKCNKWIIKIYCTVKFKYKAISPSYRRWISPPPAVPMPMAQWPWQALPHSLAALHSPQMLTCLAFCTMTPSSWTTGMGSALAPVLLQQLLGRSCYRLLLFTGKFWFCVDCNILIFALRMTFIVGVVGNVLIILTVIKNSFKSPTNTFLGSLASIDLLLILTCLPVKVIAWIHLSE